MLSCEAATPPGGWAALGQGKGVDWREGSGDNGGKSCGHMLSCGGRHVKRPIGSRKIAVLEDFF